MSSTDGISGGGGGSSVGGGGGADSGQAANPSESDKSVSAQQAEAAPAEESKAANEKASKAAAAVTSDTARDAANAQAAAKAHEAAPTVTSDTARNAANAAAAQKAEVTTTHDAYTTAVSAEKATAAAQPPNPTETAITSALDAAAPRVGSEVAEAVGRATASALAEAVKGLEARGRLGEVVGALQGGPGVGRGATAAERADVASRIAQTRNAAAITAYSSAIGNKEKTQDPTRHTAMHETFTAAVANRNLTDEATRAEVAARAVADPAWSSHEDPQARIASAVIPTLSQATANQAVDALAKQGRLAPVVAATQIDHPNQTRMDYRATANHTPTVIGTTARVNDLDAFTSIADTDARKAAMFDATADAMTTLSAAGPGMKAGVTATVHQGWGAFTDMNAKAREDARLTDIAPLTYTSVTPIAEVTGSVGAQVGLKVDAETPFVGVTVAGILNAGSDKVTVSAVKGVSAERREEYSVEIAVRALGYEFKYKDGWERSVDYDPNAPVFGPNSLGNRLDRTEWTDLGNGFSFGRADAPSKFGVKPEAAMIWGGGIETGAEVKTQPYQQ